MTSTTSGGMVNAMIEDGIVGTIEIPDEIYGMPEPLYVIYHEDTPSCLIQVVTLDHFRIDNGWGEHIHHIIGLRIFDRWTHGGVTVFRIE